MWWIKKSVNEAVMLLGRKDNCMPCNRAQTFSVRLGCDHQSAFCSVGPGAEARLIRQGDCREKQIDRAVASTETFQSTDLSLQFAVSSRLGACCQ